MRSDSSGLEILNGFFFWKLSGPLMLIYKINNINLVLHWTFLRLKYSYKHDYSYSDTVVPAQYDGFKFVFFLVSAFWLADVCTDRSIFNLNLSRIQEPQ